MQHGIIVAIDGPAGSGKSTAAKMLAEAKGLVHLNTGAMYRATTLMASQAGVIDAPDKLAELAQQMCFQYKVVDGQQRFHVGMSEEQVKDVTEQLFTLENTERMKPVVSNADVREALVEKMRVAARRLIADGERGVVLEGRDIGTVVFPDATVKIFIHASIEARTQRRADELRGKGDTVDEAALSEQLRLRDEADRNRAVGPLKQADDAIDLDTSNMDRDQVLQKLVELVP